MKQSEAVIFLRNLMFIAQKFRSNSFERAERGGWSKDATQKVFADLFPWLSGDKNIVIGLSKILDVVDRGGDLSPQDFYNMMFVVGRWLPQLNVIAPLFGLPEFPEPDIHWMSGWD